MTTNDTTTKAREEAIARIAREALGLDTLETRKSDQLDFHDLAVWQVRKALTEAYECGRAAGEYDDEPGDVAPEDACPNCGERRRALLAWFDNADQVQCDACDHIYAPPRAAKTAGAPRSGPRGW